MVPGDWSAADLRYQAAHVATQRLHNGGFNCIATQVVLLSSDWPQKDAFLADLRAALAAAPARPAWYPGCAQRVQAARQQYPSAQAVGGTPERTLLEGLGPAHADEPALTTEYFAPVLAVTELPGDGAEFLDGAAALANKRLHGTLGANIIVAAGLSGVDVRTAPHQPIAVATGLRACRDRPGTSAK